MRNNSKEDIDFKASIIIYILGMIALLVIICAVALIPAFLLILAVNFMLEVAGSASTIPLTFWSVLCVAIILSALKSIFRSKKE